MTKKFDAIKEKESSVRSERADHWRTLKELGRYLWPKDRLDLRVRVILALACLAAAKIFNVVVPFLMKRAVDALATPAINEGTLSLVIGLILAYAMSRVLTQAFGELRDFVFAKVSQHTQRIIGLNTFKHLHALSLAFHLERQTGGLSRVIERGTRGIQTVLQFMLFNILPTLLEVFMVAVILFFNFGWPLALITCGTIVVYIVYTLTLTDWRVRFRRTMNEKDSEANTRAIDSLLNYETVKYFGNEAHEFNRFDHALRGYERAAVKSQTSLSLLNVGQGFIVALGQIAVMAIAAKGVIAHTMTVGDFVLVNTYLMQLYIPLNFLGFVYRETKQSLIDMDKMFELLKLNLEVRDRDGALALSVPNGEVSFEHVSFGYNEDRVILKDVSFKVPPGKSVAIVGPSGAGKSTISRLLFRFYDVTSGSIRIDGQDIRDVTQSSLRQAIGIVPQDTVLFNDTIGYNIRYGRPASDETEMHRAAELARIASFIGRLPDGYKTMVGERGLKLSGGEKQRVAIARTILKNPRILLFDEATSALDSHTEREIQGSLREVSMNRTTLVIAHRLSTVVDADEILVLKDGEICERGSHADLLARGGEYASMWAKQAQAREAEAKLKAADI
jgi:ATP-binding cassette, subfamily B, heavy metal transporter